MESRKIGVLGAGQLGRMFVEAASRLNIEVHLLDVGPSAPAKQISSNPHHIDGKFSDADKISALARQVDVLTIEIEHVDAQQLQRVLDQGPVKHVHPLPSTIRLIQDKYAQKVHLTQHGLPVAEYMAVGPDERDPSSPASSAKEQAAGIQAAGQGYGYPIMVKSRTQAYDGRGNFVVRDPSQASQAVEALGGGSRGLYAEKWAPFEREVAVMVVRSSSGEVRAYPAVETVHKDSICHSVYAPLRHADASVEAKAREIAERAVATFGGAGVFGVELFLMKDGQLYINEIAPRPHNSGHYTIEATETSQYENHVRAILGLPLGGTRLKVGSAAMVNILGLADSDEDPEAVTKTLAPVVRSLSIPGATTHLYGKAGCRRGRKMGHITVVGNSDAQVRQRLQPILDALDVATETAKSPAHKLPKELTLAGVVDQPSVSEEAAAAAAAAAASKATKSAADFAHPQPLVGIIMGSDSDLGVMLPAAQILKRFNVPFELTIVSAHRTPDRMRDYARSAPSRGLRAIIAGAGGAAHLPGMVAAQTALPVIGVPVKGSTLDGVDSLHSIVQMPRGIPVASVAINNSTNAALLAVRILAAADPTYLKAMDDYMREMEDEVLAKVDRLGQEGWDYQVKK